MGDKMIEVIKFVMVRGPAYGYNLNMKKSVYLMAPLGRDISQRDLDVRIRALTNLGIPVDNIKIHPDCQWLRAQLPHHGRRFVDEFRKQQMRLVASYHGVYEAIEFDDRWSDVHDWYERATLPIEMGGMAMFQGRFNEDDDFSAILKTIAALEEHVEVNSGEAQLQSSSQASLHSLNVVQRPRKDFFVQNSKSAATLAKTYLHFHLSP